MPEQGTKRWYQKKRYILVIFFIGWAIFHYLIDKDAKEIIDSRESKLFQAQDQ